jgi:hypothetical protein
MTSLDYITDISWLPKGSLKTSMGLQYVETHGQCFDNGTRFTREGNEWKRTKV